MSIISEFAPNDSDALIQFSELLASRPEPPTGFLDGVAVWQVDLAPEAKAPHEETRIFVEENWVSYLDRTHGTKLSIKLDDARNTLPDVQYAELTSSELRLAIVLTAGMTLQEAADADGTSYQTKRSQLKSIFSKTGHAKQHSLVASVGSELASFFERFRLTKDENSFHWKNYTKYLPKGVRVGMLYGEKAEPIPYLDYGPVEGEIAFILHPFIFPRLVDDDIAFAQRMGHRFIWPIRPGALSRSCDQNKPWAEFVDECIREMAICFDTFSSKPAEIIALTSSGVIATRFAQFYPKKVSGISYVATFYPPGFSGSGLGEFWGSIMTLLSKDSTLGHYTMQFVGSLAAQTKLFKNSLLGTYRKNPIDDALVRAELDDTDRLARLMYATLESYKSISHDFASMAHFDWNDVSQLICQTSFVHGSEDHIHDADEIDQLSRDKTGKSPVYVENVAQWTEGANLRALLEAALKERNAQLARTPNGEP